MAGLPAPLARWQGWQGCLAGLQDRVHCVGLLSCLLALSLCGDAGHGSDLNVLLLVLDSRQNEALLKCGSLLYPVRKLVHQQDVACWQAKVCAC